MNQKNVIFFRIADANILCGNEYEPTPEDGIIAFDADELEKAKAVLAANPFLMGIAINTLLCDMTETYAGKIKYDGINLDQYGAVTWQGMNDYTGEIFQIYITMYLKLETKSIDNKLVIPDVTIRINESGSIAMRLVDINGNQSDAVSNIVNDHISEGGTTRVEMLNALMGISNLNGSSISFSANDDGLSFAFGNENYLLENSSGYTDRLEFKLVN